MDDTLRVAFTQTGHERGWPPVPHKPGHPILAKPDAWRGFVVSHGDEEVRLALRALEAYGGPGDG